jgi:hypothetical protein
LQRSSCNLVVWLIGFPTVNSLTEEGQFRPFKKGFTVESFFPFHFV